MKENKRDKMVEDIDLGMFFEIATSNKIYVNSSHLHENKCAISKDYTGDFELNGLINVGPIESKKLSGLIIWMILKIL